MPEITYKIYDSIDRIAKKDWDDIFGNIPESFAFYKALGDSELYEFSFFYLVIYSDDEIVLIAPLFSKDFNLDIAVEGKLTGVIRWIRKIYPRFLVARTLFCGSPFSEFGVLGIRPSYPDKAKLISVLNSGLKNLALKIKAPLIIFKDFPESSQPFLDLLLKKGFSRAKSFPTVVVELNFKSLAEYFASLSASTRKNLNRKIKQAYMLGNIEVKVVQDVLPQIDQVMNLYENAYRGGSTKFERLTKKFFLQIAQDLSPHVRFFLYYIDNKLAAFNLCFIYDNLFIDKFIGFDYDVSRRYNLYFISWVNNIQWCIDHSLSYYYPGQTDYEPKIRLGGKLVTLFVYLKHRNTILNFLLKPLILMLKPDNFDQELRA
ncbi:MAG: GNAT family N-acetyltransferase [Candidatus Omnitrophica bacterium]|nr:GNAT family N-acetyltransferase [Candidatus Omnitrophota bacterium]